MSKGCGKDNVRIDPEDPCRPPGMPCCSGSGSAADDADCPLGYFANMIDNCCDYASAAKTAGRPIVGIMCEYTPREVIMAAGGVPVCLCGGSAETIATAEEHLPANLCPLIKSTFGYHVQKTNPFLEMADLVVAETTCDGKKKMYELMAESRDLYILELPQKQDDASAMQYWVNEVRRLKEHLEKRFEVSICDERLREAIGKMNKDRSLKRQLAELMKKAPPPLTGRQLLDLKSIISCMPSDFEQYEKAIDLFGAKDDDGELSSRVRVLLTGVPIVHGAEKVVDIIEFHGGLVVCMENCTGLKPVIEDVDQAADDPIQAIAEKYFHLPCSVMTVNDRRLDSLRRLISDYHPQCVIELIWQACLTYDVESSRTRRLVEDELNLPYMRIETDYSPSDSARIGVRVEALFETLAGKNNQPA